LCRPCTTTDEQTSTQRESAAPRHENAHPAKAPHRDEVGYLGLDQAGAAMVFQVVCNRYKTATIITSNKPFAECVGNAYKWIKENGFC